MVAQMNTKKVVLQPQKRWLVITGLSFIVVGIFLLCQWPKIFDKIVNNKLILSENSATYAPWKDTPGPVYTEFYFFNWTNPEDFKNASTKPILTELGPYVYREERTKIVDAWHGDNGTVTFRQKRTWHFEPEMSNGSLHDVITTINIVAASAEFSAKDLDSFTKMLIDGAVQGMDTKYFVRATVNQLLFEGYDDPLLNAASIIPSAEVAVTKFGFFHERNGSEWSDGVFNMKTGAGDLKKIGQIVQWNYSNETTYKSHCGQLKGSAGDFFPRHPNKAESVSVFSPEICRSVHLDFEGEGQVDGIPVYRYATGEKLFAHQDSNADNWCFCPSEDKSKCPPSGVLDLSSCKRGTPAYLSFPHFYHADPSYRQAVIGMNPDPSKHTTFIELERKLRIPLQGRAAFQINFLVEEQEGFSVFEGVPRTYFPTMWFSQSVRIGEDKTVIKLIIYLPVALDIFAYLSLFIGFLLLAFAVSCFVVSQKSPRKNKTNVSYIAVPEYQTV